MAYSFGLFGLLDCAISPYEAARWQLPAQCLNLITYKNKRITTVATTATTLIKMTTQYNRDQTVVLTDHTQWIKWIAQLENKCVPLRAWNLFERKADGPATHRVTRYYAPRD